MIKIIKFEDLVFKPHLLDRGRVQASVEFADGSSASIIGGSQLYGDGVNTSEIGGSQLYGDGVNTFEVFFSDEDNPRGWQTKEEIEEEFIKRGIPFINMI